MAKPVPSKQDTLCKLGVATHPVTIALWGKRQSRGSRSTLATTGGMRPALQARDSFKIEVKCSASPKHRTTAEAKGSPRVQDQAGLNSETLFSKTSKQTKHRTKTDAHHL